MCLLPNYNSTNSVSLYCGVSGVIIFLLEGRVGMDSRTLIAEIKADGWRLIRVNGSHHHFTHPTKPGLVTIPHPKKELPIGTVKSIRKQAGI
ncbi:YcfA-like protein [Kluyvera cryocrescens]|uniref:YcfA-like protein n=2 Tax=Kluyvera cryocrescens TaxID=580 RepID=A0A2X3EBD1_KLUCR|nr:YcfA-like protein [Kluyvera cryocrescens]VFS76955.1 YcfA-like protein [Kluyvera cryocrescens]